MADREEVEDVGDVVLQGELEEEDAGARSEERAPLLLPRRAAAIGERDGG
jgi:hypothetical protein